MALTASRSAGIGRSSVPPPGFARLACVGLNVPGHECRCDLRNSRESGRTSPGSAAASAIESLEVVLGQELSAVQSAAALVEPNPIRKEALALALEAHEGPRREGGTHVDHPLLVAELLAEAGYDDEVVAAGLLHDVVENSSIGLDEIESRCGLEVRRLVAALTEDATIDPWATRKAEHRIRIANQDRVVGAIYAADKLAKVRMYAAAGELPAPRKLRHYRRTVRTLGTSFPGLPFLEELHAELEDLIVSFQSNGTRR